MGGSFIRGWRYCALLAAVISGAVCSVGRCQQQQLPPHIVEKIARQFEVVAAKFDADPTGNQIAQEAFNVLMVAEALQLKQYSNPMKTRLLMRAPQSLQARYLLTTFATPDDYRKLLLGRFDEESHHISHEFGKQFVVAVQMGATRWRDELLTGDEFLLKTSLAAQSCYAHTVLAECRSRIEKLDNESSEIAKIVFGDLSNSEKYVELAEYRENGNSHCFMRQLFHMLEDEEVQSPKVLRIRAATLLAAKKFSDALPVIDQVLEKDSTPQATFWKAWAQAATDDVEGAKATLAKVVEQEGEWARSGRQLLETLEKLDESLAEHERIVAQVVKTVVDAGVSRVSAKAVFHSLGVEATMIADFDEPAFGLHIAERDRTLISYLVNADASKLFLAESKQVVGSKGPGALPAITMKLNKSADGKFNFNYAVGMSKSKLDARRWTDDLFGSRWLATSEGRRELAQHNLERGMFPASPVTDDQGRTTLTWLSPSVDDPKIDRGEIVVDRKGALHQLRFDQFELTEIAYDDRPFDYAQIRFPSGPVQWRENFDGQVLFQVMGAVYSVMERTANTKQVAGRAAEAAK